MNIGAKLPLPKIDAPYGSDLGIIKIKQLIRANERRTYDELDSPQILAVDMKINDSLKKDKCGQTVNRSALSQLFEDEIQLRMRKT